MSTPVFGWPVPSYPTKPPDGPAAFQALANAIEATFDAVPTAYTPAWTSDGPAQPGALASGQGYWQHRNGLCTVAIYFSFGASTTGGRGALVVGLPMTSIGYEQQMPCKMYVPGVGDFSGMATIPPNANYCRPQFPIANGSGVVNNWQSSNDAGTAGTGIPPAAGAFTVANTGNFVLTGRYAVV